MADLPSGTVTFLFTDLAGSTTLLEAHPDAYRHRPAASELVALLLASLRGAGRDRSELVAERGSSVSPARS